MTNRRGFTLIEILLVLGIVGIVLAMTPIFDLSSFKKESVQDKALVFIQDLQNARSEAMNNIGGVDHGVTVGAEQIVFQKLTGNVTEEHEIVFENATITINHEGGIDW